MIYLLIIIAIVVLGGVTFLIDCSSNLSDSHDLFTKVKKAIVDKKIKTVNNR